MKKRATFQVSTLMTSALLAACTAMPERQQAVLGDSRGMNVRVVEVPPPRRALCVRRALEAKKLDGSKLMVAVLDAKDTSQSDQLAGGGGQAPQPGFVQDTVRTVHAMGLTVMMATQGTQPPYLVSVHLTAFSPVTEMETGKDTGDLGLLTGDQEMFVARGKVAAAASLWARLPDGTPTVWATSKSEGTFYQHKNKRSFNVMNKSGWLRGGVASESVEVAAVQQTASVVVQDAVAAAFSDALRLNC